MIGFSSRATPARTSFVSAFWKCPKGVVDEMPSCSATASWVAGYVVTPELEGGEDGLALAVAERRRRAHTDKIGDLADIHPAPVR